METPGPSPAPHLLGKEINALSKWAKCFVLAGGGTAEKDGSCWPCGSHAMSPCQQVDVSPCQLVCVRGTSEGTPGLPFPGGGLWRLRNLDGSLRPACCQAKSNGADR